MKQRGQHALQLGGTLRQFRVIPGLDELQIIQGYLPLLTRPEHIVHFDQRICGPLANFLIHHRPEKTTRPPARIEVTYSRAGAAIQTLVDLMAADR